MSPELDLAWIASVVGDPARSRILLALMDGRARTAKELAFLARIAAPTASGHLAKLLDGRLGGHVFPERQIEDIQRQEARDLRRFDVNFDLPDHMTPEFPAPFLWLEVSGDAGFVLWRANNT